MLGSLYILKLYSVGRNRKSKVRAIVQGISLTGKKPVKVLNKGNFIYRNHLYNIEDFQAESIDLDLTNALPRAKVKWRGDHQNKKKSSPRFAVLISNKESCSDAEKILHHKNT